jgi:hypothetical protein
MVLQLGRLLKPITVTKMPLARKPDRKNKIDLSALHAPTYQFEIARAIAHGSSRSVRVMAGC